MKCPVDPDTMLVMSERQGVEIDYCPKCRGVWLDRGELDKILERSAAESAPTPPPAAQPQAPPPPQHQQYPPQGQYPPPGQYPQRGYGDDYYKKKRKKSFLEEIFD